MGILALWTWLETPHSYLFKNVVQFTVAIFVGKQALRPGKVDPHHQVVISVVPHYLPPVLDYWRRAPAGKRMDMFRLT